MKKIPLIILCIIIPLLLPCLLYLSISFYYLDINPHSWTPASRANMSVIGLLLMILGIIIDAGLIDHILNKTIKG